VAGAASARLAAMLAQASLMFMMSSPKVLFVGPKKRQKSCQKRDFPSTLSGGVSLFFALSFHRLD
jgi:hypothetical protein